MVTTIQLDEGVKKKLDAIKVYYRETYNEIVKRLIDGYSSEDKESLTETLEIMSDPKTMISIAGAMERIKKGELGTPFKKIKKELKLDV